MAPKNNPCGVSTLQKQKLLQTRPQAFSYPEPFLRAVRRGALAKSITGYHKNMVIKQCPALELANQMPVQNMDLAILVPRALLTRGQQSATRGSGQIHIKLASDWPQRNIWFIVNMNKNTQALHEALVSLWRKLGEKTLLMLKE